MYEDGESNTCNHGLFPESRSMKTNSHKHLLRAALSQELVDPQHRFDLSRQHGQPEQRASARKDGLDCPVHLFKPLVCVRRLSLVGIPFGDILDETPRLYHKTFKQEASGCDTLYQPDMTKNGARVACWPSQSSSGKVRLSISSRRC